MATRIRDTAFIGTELKININIQPIDNITMDDYEFTVEMYCSPKRTLTIKKADAIRADANNYIVCIDTEMIGAGDLKCKVTANIPDGDFPDMFRTEVVAIDTGISIIKSL